MWTVFSLGWTTKASRPPGAKRICESPGVEAILATGFGLSPSTATMAPSPAFAT
jgi:hypothetical protein